MLNPPSGVTLADYIAASKAQSESHIKITFTNQNIELDENDIEMSGISFNDILNGEQNLVFGKAVSKEIRVPILNSSKVDNLVWTDEFQIEYGLKIGGTVQWVTVGHFIGTRPERIHNVEIIDFSAMDFMQKFNVPADDWLNSLTYPMTVLQMFQSLCTYCGVGYAAGDELANIKARSFSEAPIKQTGLMCKTILAAIAEACGCYARINAAGNCQMVWFSDHTSDYVLTGDEEFPPVVTYDENDPDLFAIDVISVKQTEDDIGAEYPVGSTGNTYIIVDNPFLVTANATEVTNYIVPLYNRIHGFGGYLPVSLSAIGCMLLEAGDIITITANGSTMSMPVFCKSTVWNGSLTDGLECTGDTASIGTPMSIVQKLSEGGRYHKFRNDLNELYSELYDASTGDITLLHQQANQIEAYAEKKARVYYSATAPSGTQSDPLETGDLWIDTANANQLKRYNGSSWVDASFDDPDKYTVRSGISIISGGIEISGSKYIKMLSGSELDIESGGKIDVKSGGDLDIESGGDINIKSGGKLNIQSGGDIDIESGGDINVKNGGNLKIVTGGTLDVDTANFKISSANKSVSSGNWKFSDSGLVYEYTHPTSGEVRRFSICKNNLIANVFNILTYYSNSGDSDVGIDLLHTTMSGNEAFIIRPSDTSIINRLESWNFIGNLTGNVTGNCSGSAGSVAWSGVTGKPSTFTPSDHTHSKVVIASSNTASTSTDTYATNGLNVRWFSQTGKAPGQPSQYGFMITLGTQDASQENHQIWAEQPNGHLYHRGTNGSSYASPPAFKTILDSGNYNTYAPQKDGTGASGTWGISITGTAGGVAWANVSGKPSNYPGGCTGTAGSVAWDNITGRPSLSSGHITDFNFTTSRPVSSYVTFDKSNPTGAPDNSWYNGFITSHNNYLASYIINKHRTSEWYVGYNEYNASTGTAPAPSWFKLLHSGNYATYAAKNTEAIKNITRSGTTFTATRCDGTTFTFTQQDNNTWRGYQTKSYSYAYSGLAGGERLNVTGTNLGISTPSGYTPVAITKVTTGNNDCVVVLEDARATGGSTAVTIRNVSSGSKSGTVGLDILYLQT